MRKILTVIVLIILLSQGSSGQTRGNVVSFDLSDTHEMEAYATGKLTWQEDQNELVTVNVTMSDFTVNNSQIVVQLIQFVSITPDGVSELQAQNASEQNLNVNSLSVMYREVLEVPNAADRFYINITILAYAIGGGADQVPREYSFRFPEDGTIIVQRDNLVPVINLYGFPPLSYFQFWIPVYGSFLAMLILPGAVFGAHKLNERINKQTSSKDEEEEDELNE